MKTFDLSPAPSKVGDFLNRQREESLDFEVFFNRHWWI